MELYYLQDTPPEKYYEACITYHLVRYFEELYNRRLYPFSISQMREKQLGFDFGYEVQRGTIFLTQYKRPVGRGKRGIIWEINKEQTETLAKVPVRSYYVLPAFLKRGEWYEGLDKTFFVPAGAVYNWMQGRKAEKCALLHEDERMITAVNPKCFDPFGRDLNSALCLESNSEQETVDQIPEEMANQICGYWIGGVIEDGTGQLF